MNPRETDGGERKICLPQTVREIVETDGRKIADVKPHDTGDFRMFRIQTTRGSFDWAARSMLSIILVFEAHELSDELIGIIELPK